MTHIRVLLLATVAGAASCGAKTTLAPTDVPPFVTTLIQELASQPRANPPASIHQFQYGGRTVYYVPPRCCDIPGLLFDTSGILICQPDGGFTGRGDGRCPDFFDKRRDGRLVWQDPR